jgi:hypothetical protein
MAFTYDDGTSPQVPRLSKAERLALGRLYRDSELRGRSDSSWEFGLLTEEDQWLAKSCYESLLIKGDIDPDPATESPVLITKGGSYVSALSQKAAGVLRLVRRDYAFDDIDPARKQTAESLLSHDDLKSYWATRLHQDPFAAHAAAQLGYTIDDLTGPEAS